MEILHRLHGGGTTIIVVSHSPEVGAHADRVIVLEHGNVAKITTGRQLSKSA